MEVILQELFAIGIFYYFIFENGNALTLHIVMTIFIIVIIFFLNLEKEFEKKDNKSFKPSRLRVFIGILSSITIMYIGLAFINNDSWSKEVHKRNIGGG